MKKHKRIREDHLAQLMSEASTETSEKITEERKGGRPSLGMGELAQRGISLPVETWAMLDQIARDQKRSRSDLLREIVDTWVSARDS